MAIKQGWTGRVFEDFEVGDVYHHPLGRTDPGTLDAAMVRQCLPSHHLACRVSPVGEVRAHSRGDPD